METTEGCFKVVPLELKVVENLDPEVDSMVIERCGENGTAVFNLTDLTPEILEQLQLQDVGLSFFPSQTAAENDGTQIGNPANFPVTGSKTLWMRAENADGCFAVVELILEVDEKPVIANPPEDLVLCIEGGSPVFDLTQQDQRVDPQGLYQVDYYASRADFQNENPIGDPANFTPVNLPKTVYVALADPVTGCVSDPAGFWLRAGETPKIDLFNFQDGVICVNPETGGPLSGETPIILDTGLSASEYEFSWQQDGNPIGFTGPALEVYQAGNYSVRVVALSGSGCPGTAMATIEYSSVPLFDLRQSGGFGSLVVEVFDIRGHGDYVFSIDGADFVPANGNNIVFENVPSGEITVIGRDLNGCGETIKSIVLLSYPKFFTPNGDGINDYWNIRALSNRPGTEIHIFDRYGKLLSIIDPMAPGWDGTYNGKRMPSNDYWFQLKYLAPNGNIEIFTNNFTLKR